MPQIIKKSHKNAKLFKHINDGCFFSYNNNPDTIFLKLPKIGNKKENKDFNAIEFIHNEKYEKKVELWKIDDNDVIVLEDDVDIISY